MREYAPITLNIIEYAGIYPKKQRAEYARISNVSDAAHSSLRSLYKLLRHLRWSSLSLSLSFSLQVFLNVKQQK